MSAVASLSATTIEPFELRDLLKRLVEVAVEHVEIDGAGAMILHDDQLDFLHAYSPVQSSLSGVQTVEHLQGLMQQGPCHDAITGRREVVVDDLEQCALPEWSAYLAGAKEVGLRSVAAIPLFGRDRDLGVLDLYRTSAGAWSDEDLIAARMLAALAVSYLVIAADRDAAREAEQELAHLNLHDQLTGLPNRALLFDRLTHALERAARHDGSVAAFFIDLDQFKQINDLYGHAAGDAVLIEVTRRMMGTLRSEDTLARLSGDEFVLVCEDLPQRTDRQLDHQLGVVKTRLNDALAEPVQIAGGSIAASASIGVAVSTSESTADDLLADADAAMYRDKQGRRNGGNVLADAGTSVRRPTRQLERDLIQALDRGELQVHYQPIMSVPRVEDDDETPALVAVEALLRWQHPTYGLMAAAEFIELAERTGSIVPIGHWVLDQVCAQMSRWNEQNCAPATAYVNVGPRQLNDPSLGRLLNVALERYRLRPGQIGLEVVEGSFVDPLLVRRLESFHTHGHRLAVDDFGTGYSSLSRLVEFPADIAKIDKSFVAGMANDVRRRSLIEAVIVVAAHLGLDIIGEGVETGQQAQLLAEAGCHLQQGYHHGSPVSAEILTRHWAARLTPELPRSAATSG